MRLLIAAPAVFWAMGAQAATIDAFAVATASTNPVLVPGGGNVQETVSEQESSLISSSLGASASASSGQASTSASSFANSETGILRAESNASGTRGDGLGDGSSVASARLSETYSVTGTGSITVSMLVDGNWSLTRPNLQPSQPDPDPFWQVQADIRIGASSRDFLCLGTACSPSIDSSSSGSITDHLLTTTAAFNSPFGAQNITISTSLFTQILTANGFIDFGNTAKILVEFSSGLTATPVDPNFLSNPAFLEDTGGGGTTPPAPVPLPAGAPLLLGGLGLLAFMRRKRAG